MPRSRHDQLGEPFNLYGWDNDVARLLPLVTIRSIFRPEGTEQDPGVGSAHQKNMLATRLMNPWGPRPPARSRLMRPAMAEIQAADELRG